jgi:hypothetical protein
MQGAEKLEILYYTPYFRETLKDAIGFSPAVAEDLCIVTLDHARFPHADAVLFHLPNMAMDSIPQEKPPGQIWIGMSLESDANYPLQCDPEFMRHFDLRMNFRRDCDVPIFYFEPGLIPELISTPMAKTRQGKAVYFASNNFALNQRFELVAELMQHMPVDSYGKSQNNCIFAGPDQGRQTKLKTIGSYDFYFAFENSNCVDYVSEKVFDGMISGAVPVYLGAPNIDEYLPGNKCIIKTSDFADGAELAGFLLELSADRTRFEEYLSWKKEPLKENFLCLVNSQSVPPLRRLCQNLLEIKPLSSRQNQKGQLQTTGKPNVFRKIKSLAKRILSV